mgnify:CR=1 FL=1
MNFLSYWLASVEVAAGVEVATVIAGSVEVVITLSVDVTVTTGVEVATTVSVTTGVGVGVETGVGVGVGVGAAWFSCTTFTVDCCVIGVVETASTAAAVALAGVPQAHGTLDHSPFLITTHQTVPVAWSVMSKPSVTATVLASTRSM